MGLEPVEGLGRRRSGCVEKWVIVGEEGEEEAENEGRS